MLRTSLRVLAVISAIALVLAETPLGAFARRTILAANAQSAIASAARGFSLSNIDPTCKPCTDFYRYAAGGWLANNPIPATQTRWSALEILRESNRVALREIAESAARESNPRGSPADKVGDYYASCMDAHVRDASGLTAILPILGQIASIRDLAGVRSLSAALQNDGANAFLVAATQSDFRDGGRTIISISQGGLGLPDRDLYFTGDARSAQIREAYGTHVARLLALSGDDRFTANAGARTVLSIETALARNSRSREARRDRINNYHRLSLAETQTLAPTFDVAAFFVERGAPRPDFVDVEQPEFLRGLEVVLRTTPLGELRTYLRAHLLMRSAPALTTTFSEEAASFDAFLSGQREGTPPWSRCVRALDADLGDLLGQLYVARHFTSETRTAAKSLIDNIELSFREQLGSSWMSELTRREALVKLDGIVDKVGYPETWRAYKTLDVDRGPFINNSLRSSQYRARSAFSRIGKPPDRSFWSMTAPTINASYVAASNEMTFPAGILQAPLFSRSYDDAVNYGALGAIVGHELTHAFDDQGRHTDSRGLLRDWWQPIDASAFGARAMCLERQYDAFVVVDDLRENGRYTVGESFADLGGAQIAYRALQHALAGKPRITIDGWTPEQRFFLAFAAAHASHDRPERARLNATTDPHPSGRSRVIGTLSNMPEFAAAFHCKSRDAMVRPQLDRCSVW